MTPARTTPELPWAKYITLEGWRWSHLKLLRSGSLRHVRHARANPDESTADQLVLSAIHAALLEPAEFTERYSVYEGKGNRGSKGYKEFCAEHPDTVALKLSEHERVMACRDSVMSHPDVIDRQLLKGGQSEITIEWTDPESKLKCLCRIDHIGPGALVDLKGAGTDERQVATLAARHSWHGQLAHYRAGLQAVGVEVPRAFIISYETKPPYDVAVFKLEAAPPDGALCVGAQLRREMLCEALRVEALHPDAWDGRHAKVQPLVLPPYALPDPDITFGD